MEFLLIESESARRVVIAKHLCGFGHRVTLASSIAEAQDLLGFLRIKTECPSAVLIAEELLGRSSDSFRSDLAARFPNVAWVPVPHDVDLDWLHDWLDRTAARQRRVRQRQPARRRLDVLFVEEDPRVRREVARHLTARGDRVVACASIARARQEIAKALPTDVLIAPVRIGADETISLFLAAQKRRPSLRWIVPSPVHAATPLAIGATHAQQSMHSTFCEIDRLRRTSSDSEGVSAGAAATNRTHIAGWGNAGLQSD